MVKEFQMWIGGRWAAAQSGQTREVRDPGNGELLAKVPEGDGRDAAAAIQAARAAFDAGPWRKTTAQDRGKLLFRLADKIRGAAKMLAELEVRNCGKPLAEAEFDVADAETCLRRVLSVTALS